MLSKEDNDLLTQTGPGTPGGAFMRRYWQPVALVEELQPDGPPLAVRLLSEDLVLFRDDAGRIGLLGIHCPHRGTDLSYGRIEDGGLRCLYHGWLYDINGRCLEQPNEPSWSNFKDKIRHRAYPCQEKADVIFAYLGPGEPPLLPAYGALEAPEDHRWAAKHYHECNYMQGNEGNYDSTHVSWLHGYFDQSDLIDKHPKEQTSIPVVGEDERRAGQTEWEREMEEVDFGVRMWHLSRESSGRNKKSVGISNFILPNLCAVQGGPAPAGDGYLINWHVPIDDEHHWRYSIAFKRSGPLDPELGRRRTAMLTPDYHFIQNRSNRYLQDREEMKTRSLAGFGEVNVVGDHFATESAGPILDRTQEHLGISDLPIIAARRSALKAIREIQEGGEPNHVIRTPEENDLTHIVVGHFQVDDAPTLKEYRQRHPLPNKLVALGR